MATHAPSLPAQPPPPPRRSLSPLVISMAVVIAVLVVLVALYASGTFTSSSGSGQGGPAIVEVTSVNFSPTTETSACWTSTTGTGGLVYAGSNLTVTLNLSYAGGSSEPPICEVQSVSVATAGFSIISTNTPLTVYAGSTQTLRVVLGTPATAFRGAVTIDLDVTLPRAPIGAEFAFGSPAQTSFSGAGCPSSAPPGTCYAIGIEAAGSSATTANVDFGVLKSGSATTFTSVSVVNISGTVVATFTYATGSWTVSAGGTLPLALSSVDTLILGSTTSLAGDELEAIGVGSLSGSTTVALP